MLATTKPRNFDRGGMFLIPGWEGQLNTLPAATAIVFDLPCQAKSRRKTT